jgi:hypothetical protein
MLLRLRPPARLPLKSLHIPAACFSTASLEKVSYQRIPIRPLELKVHAPTTQDYEELGLFPIADNNCVVSVYRNLMKKYHPEHNPLEQERWKAITAAYDRIMLYRMQEQGLPEPYTPAYRGILPTGKAINALSKA